MLVIDNNFWLALLIKPLHSTLTPPFLFKNLCSRIFDKQNFVTQVLNYCDGLDAQKRLKPSYFITLQISALRTVLFGIHKHNLSLPSSLNDVTDQLFVHSKMNWPRFGSLKDTQMAEGTGKQVGGYSYINPRYMEIRIWYMESVGDRFKQRMKKVWIHLDKRLEKYVIRIFSCLQMKGVVIMFQTIFLTYVNPQSCTKIFLLCHSFVNFY